VREGRGKKSDIESEDPTEVDDMVFFEEEERREVILTSAVCHDPTVMSAGDEQEAERRTMVLMPRKRAASTDTIGKREAKRTWSPCPLVALSVPSPPTGDAAEQAGQSEEQVGTRVSLGPVPERDSQPEDAPPAAPVGAS